MTHPPTRVFRVLSILFAILLVTVSSWPRLKVPDIGVTGMDKVAHFTQYAILTYLVVRGWSASSGHGKALSGWLWVLLLVLFAAADEFHQGWIPGRDPDWHDWVADSLGILCGFGLDSWQCRRRLLKADVGTADRR
ncbi:MAG: VanZ family protein [candidate division Zixibacteria bacterium]|nr:VanZ family protein [candidate division Zixibacteria bacterium]